MVTPPVMYVVFGTALSLLTQLAAGLLGPFGFMLGLLSPLPAAFAGMRFGWKVAAGIVLATTAALFVITGSVAALAYGLQYGLPAWLLTLLLRRDVPWDRAVARTLLVFIGFAAVALFGYTATSEGGLQGTVHRYVHGEVERAMAFWNAADLPPEQLDELRLVSEEMAGFLVEAWPGLAVAAAGALLLIIILFLSSASQGKYRVAGPPFQQWKAPEMLIWVLIAGGAGMLFTGGGVQRIALNLMVLVLPIYFLQGLAIVTHWFRKRGVSPFLRRLGYLFIIIVNPLPVVVTGLGVFDMWIDFRKPKVKKN